MELELKLELARVGAGIAWQGSAGQSRARLYAGRTLCSDAWAG